MRLIFFFLLVLIRFSIAEAMCDTALQQLTDYAFEHNPTIEAYRHQVDAASAAVCQQKYESFSPCININSGAISENLTCRKDTYTYGFIAAEWNIFRGGKDVADVKIRQELLCLAEVALEKEKKRLAYDIARKYYSILFLKQSLATYDEFVTCNEQHLEIACRKRSEGMTSDLDVIEFELLKKEKLEAQTELENLYLSEINALNFLLGGYNEINPECFNGSFPDRKSNTGLCRLIDTALVERDDLLQNEKETKVLETEYRRALSGYLPRVDLYASYGYEPNLPGDRGNGTRLWINLSIPLGTTMATHYEREKIAHLIEAQRALHSQIESDISSEISTTVAALKRLEILVQLTEDRLHHVEHYWNITQDEYSRGVKNSPDLANALVRYLDLKIRLLTLRKDYANSLIDLAEASGQYP